MSQVTRAPLDQPKPTTLPFFLLKKLIKRRWISNKRGLFQDELLNCSKWVLYFLGLQLASRCWFFDCMQVVFFALEASQGQPRPTICIGYTNKLSWNTVHGSDTWQPALTTSCRTCPWSCIIDIRQGLATNCQSCQTLSMDIFYQQ